MTLSYQEVMEADLSKLTGAWKAWQKVSEKMKGFKTDYGTHVAKVLDSGNWKGHSFTASGSASSITKHEFGAAEAEAKALSEILKEAHTQLTELRDNLKSVVKQVEKQGYTVSATGRVTVNWDAKPWTDMSPAALKGFKNDPSSVAAAEASREAQIKKAVQQVDDADHGVRLALNAAVTDRDGKGFSHGFNSAAEGDMEKVEGRRAADLAMRINEGKELSPKERAEFLRLNRDNSDDRAFSRTMLTTLGPDGAIQFSRNLREAGKKGDALEKGFAQTVATATTVPGKAPGYPPGSEKYKQWLKTEAGEKYTKWLKTADGKFYKEFMSGLQKHGDDNYGSNTEPEYGYQEFVTLLKEGGAKYDDNFLHNLADNITKMEKDKDFGIWDMWNGPEKGLAHDPLDGVLGLMGQNPDAANHYLDPARSGRLEYLIKDRDWPAYILNGPGSVTENDTMARMHNYEGLGAAIKAAATGTPPGVDPEVLGIHTKSQATIMHDTILLLKEEGMAEEMPPHLRRPMAEALKDYTPDTHTILGRGVTPYELNHDDEKAVWDLGHDGNYQMTVERGDLYKIMRGIADDPTAYAELYRAEQEFALQEFGGIDPESKKADIAKAVNASATATGAYDGVLAEAVLDKKDRIEDYSFEFNHTVNNVAGANLNFGLLPKAAGLIAPLDITDRLISTWSYHYTEEMRDQAALEATEKNAKQFSAGQQNVVRMISQWATGHENPDTGKPYTDTDSFVTRNNQEGLDKYQSGRDEAIKKLHGD